jgi:protoporphyrinogen oxidase
LSDASGSLGTTILPKVTVGNIKPERTGFLVTADGNSTKYDAVLLTVPSAIAARIVPSLPQQYVNRLLSIPHLHAQIVILETKKPILEENIYWLNITDPTFPFLAVVGHTNLIDPSQYGGHHLTYLGNYLPEGHRYLTMRTESILDEYLPYVRKLNRSFRRTDVISVNSFIGPFAQPVHTIGYSHRAPETRTPIASLYLSNMDSIYPWDRGTNYAVRIGLDAARTIDSDRK